MKHTPGPWSLSDDIVMPEVPCVVVEASQKRVAEVCSSLNEKTDDFEITVEDRANAALIVAAPDMLEALEAAHLLLSQYLFSGPTSRLLESTIKKARGEFQSSSGY